MAPDYQATETTAAGNLTVTDTYPPGTGETSTDYVMMVVHSIIASIGVVGNLTVIIALANNKKLRVKVPNMFIINQSLIDFCASVILLLSTITVRNSFHVAHDGTLGYLECTIWNTRVFLWGLFVASTWNLVSLTIERYLELIHPLWHKAHFKTKWVYVSMVTCWCFGIGLNAAYMIPTTKIDNGLCYMFSNWICPELKSSFGITLMFIQFFIPFITLVYCHGTIFRMLSHRLSMCRRDDINNANSSNNNNHGNNAEAPYTIDNAASTTDIHLNLPQLNQQRNISNKGDKFQIARRNTIKTLLVVGLCFIICWSNNQVYYLMFNLGYDVDWNGIYYQFTILMVFMNCVVNPFIYLIKYDDYQKALKKFIGKYELSG